MYYQINKQASGSALFQNRSKVMTSSKKFGFAVDVDYFHAHNPQVENNSQYGEYYVAKKIKKGKLICFKAVRQNNMIETSEVAIPLNECDFYRFFPNTLLDSRPATQEEIDNWLLLDAEDNFEYLLEYLNKEKVSRKNDKKK